MDSELGGGNELDGFSFPFFQGTESFVDKGRDIVPTLYVIPPPHFTRFVI